jgi:hypothetical protein
VEGVAVPFSTDYQADEMTAPTLCETRWNAIVAFERNHEELTTKS